MTIDDGERMLGLKVTDGQRIAAAFLDSQGKKFCVDYGIENCESMAVDLMERCAGWASLSM